MSKTENITVPQGDFGYNLNFTLKDAEGNARNMTGYTAKLKVWKAGKPTVLLIDSACVWISITLGTCYYTVVSGNFDIVGHYAYEIEAIITVAEVITARESAQSGLITVVESPKKE